MDDERNRFVVNAIPLNTTYDMVTPFPKARAVLIFILVSVAAIVFSIFVPAHIPVGHVQSYTKEQAIALSKRDSDVVFLCYKKNKEFGAKPDWVYQVRYDREKGSPRPYGYLQDGMCYQLFTQKYKGALQIYNGEGSTLYLRMGSSSEGRLTFIANGQESERNPIKENQQQ